MTGSRHPVNVSRYANLLIGICMIATVVAVLKSRSPERAKFDFQPVSDPVPDLTGESMEAFQAKVGENVQLRGKLNLNAKFGAALEGAEGRGVSFYVVPIPGVASPASWTALAGRKVRVTGVLGTRPADPYSLGSQSSAPEESIAKPPSYFFMAQETVRLEPDADP